MRKNKQMNVDKKRSELTAGNCCLRIGSLVEEVLDTAVRVGIHLVSIVVVSVHDRRRDREHDQAAQGCDVCVSMVVVVSGGDDDGRGGW